MTNFLPAFLEKSSELTLFAGVMIRFVDMCVKSFLLSSLLLLSCTPCTVGCDTQPSEAGAQRDEVTDWMELPELGDGLVFVTHPMEMDGKSLRNYSYAWDKYNLVARWVAYPMNTKIKSGKGGRSEQWGLDPKLPEDDQPVLFNTYSGKKWSRGHQIPSGDRKIYKYNVETFYGVNMTPQNYTLNGGIWAKLEEYVRNRCDSFDTLYVVSGCTLEGSLGKVYDNVGKAVTIPGGYFKALLGYDRSGHIGKTGSQQGFTGIAFFLENKAIQGQNFLDYSMTISELEEKVGINFFANLPLKIDSAADKVESSRDGWWYQANQ